MNEREIADWEREIRHAEKMQEQRKSKQREGWDGKKISFWSTDLLQIEIDNLNKRVKEQNNEIN